MHYTAMAGMRLDPTCYDAASFVSADSALSRNTLALLATVISFGVSGAFLLSLVPEGETAATAAPTPSPVAQGREAAPPVAETAPAAAQRTPAIRVEKDGRQRDITADEIYAIRANAHYCYVHDGEHEYFCNQSISALEALLDPERFFRSHRSYIVRLSRVSRVKRAGEAALAELGDPVRCSIPVARAQYRELRERLGLIAPPPGAAIREIRQSG